MLAVGEMSHHAFSCATHVKGFVTEYHSLDLHVGHVASHLSYTVYMTAVYILVREVQDEVAA